LSLAVHGGRALLSTTLVHRYRQYSQFDPKRLVVHARVLLVRDAQGIWRLATVEPLLPLVATDHHAPFTDAELDRLYRTDVRKARKASAAAARHEAQRTAATVDGAAPAPCAAELHSDPGGDVVVQESEFRARDQRANAGLDLVGVGVAGRCVALRMAGPLPASFQVDLRGGDHLALLATVADGHVVVEDTSDDDAYRKPVPGVAAHLDPDGLVLLLPRAVKAPATVMSMLERGDVTYSDDATRRATSRRCARPTC
jgi:hypothetical protein